MECVKAGLSGGGKTEDLRRRLLQKFHHHASITTKTEKSNNKIPSKPNPKKRTSRLSSASSSSADSPRPTNKRNKVSIAENYLCPISHQLPFDPVIADDGHTYERSEIEEYFKKSQPQRNNKARGGGGGSGQVRSPMTNKMISKRLVPSFATKNSIESLIENGYITGSLADQWKERAEEKKYMDAQLKKAQDGDVNAMEEVACCYLEGTDGFKLDLQKSFDWYDKARVAGSVRGMTEVGYMLLEGKGVAKNEKRGIMYLCLGAEKGSDWAAYWLGMALADGLYGLPIDKPEAMYWLQKCLFQTCSVQYLTQEGKEEAQTKLNGLLDKSD